MARPLWLEGKLDEAGKEYERLLTGASGRERLGARRQLDLLEAEKARLEKLFREAVDGLAKEARSKGRERLSVALGKVNYAAGQAGSSFGEFLASNLSLALVRSAISPRERLGTGDRRQILAILPDC